ncbi:TonB-linked outer membrane protein, SusC/RagA family [Maribacter orientalis]|uniref:TonB-linked outer membrane protein, SusC/RagA family n=1 Tax=Maribacter orientalis TaxID=228957 RepID=A0A1H7RXR7_9FLAO|nr:TonB-dependent receptor [Maribacter orientalis]SEL64985.1 TonB-linked outer membrane protein, SusC/RagA family [Maribacter orientalis]
MNQLINFPKFFMIRSHAILTMVFFFGGLLLTSIHAQEVKVSGTVTSAADNMPLPGVSVIDAKNPTRGVQADFDGNFTITLDDGNTSLRFSYIGFKSAVVPVNNQNTINVSLEEDVANLEEVVVVGYGTQKKATVTGAVTAVQGPVLESSPAISVSNSLAGRLPGVVIIQTSGEPGNDQSTISIRGTNTLGNNQPLIVIDGIPDRDGGISRINSNDIANISVLKDASAAIYGARAANGAIIVTTKTGNVGKMEVKYNADFGLTRPTRVPEMASAVEYQTIMNELAIYNSNIPAGQWGAASSAFQNNGSYTIPGSSPAETVNAAFSPETINNHRTNADPWLYPDTDWFGATFQDWAEQQRHNLSVSGGSEDLKYYASLGYSDQGAIYKNSANRYQQYNFRINTDAKINEYLSTKLSMGYRKENRNFPTESAGAIFRMLMRGRPNEPAVWPNGLPGPDIENGQQPVVITTNATGYDNQPTDYLQFTGSVDIKNPWVDGLTLTLLAGVDQSQQRRKLWQTPWTLYSLDRANYIATGNPVLSGAIRSNFTDPRLTQSSLNVLNTNLTGLLNYDKTIGDDHTINLLAGVTRENFQGEFLSAFRRNYLSAAVDQIGVGGEDGQVTDGFGYNRTRLGYYGRAQYNFKEKYLAEFIWRYDGSYIFPGDDRFGFFPGFLVGWNINKEDWFNVESIDYLKLRASYGQMGNDQVFFQGALQEYAYLSIYDFGSYPIDGNVQTTLTEPLLANPSFTWERANNLNVGLDGITLNGKLSFTLEYFLNRRDQILIQKTGSTPGSSGISDLLPPVNAGKVDNEGFEFALNYYGGDADSFKWDVGVNGGYAQNSVVFLDEIPGAPDYQLQEGKPIGSYLVYESDGVFIDEAAVSSNTLDYSAVKPQLEPGDMKFKDINGDGAINDLDQVRLDNSIVPNFNFGATFNASYKNFDLSVLLQGATGAKLPILTESGDIGNYLKYSFDNRWSPDNPSSVHPRLASRGDTYYSGGAYGNNTYNLYSKDYIRLKNVQIAYNFPKGMIDQFGLSAFRVYMSGLNLATWAAQDIYDPESTSNSGQFYPQQSIINTGFSLTF